MIPTETLQKLRAQAEDHAQRVGLSIDDLTHWRLYCSPGAVLELLDEIERLRAATAFDGMSYGLRSEFSRLKHADVDQGKRIAELITERDAARAEVERLRIDRDSFANSDFERQLDEARQQLAAVSAARDELATMLEAIDARFGIKTHRIAELRLVGRGDK